MTYALCRTLARFSVAVGALTVKQTLDKYEVQWLIATVVALIMAMLLFMAEQRLKSELAE